MKEDLEKNIAHIDHLISVSRFEEAIRLCNAQLLLDPENEDILYYLAFSLYSQDKLEDAESVGGKFLGLYPDSFLALIINFFILRARQKFSAAELLIIRLIRDYPERAGLYAHYSNLLAQNFQFEKAKKLIDEGFRLDPENEEVLVADCLLATAQGKVPGRSLSELVKLHPDQIRTCMLLAHTLVKKGRNKEAFQIYREVFIAYPESQDIQDNLIALKVNSHPLSWILFSADRFGTMGPVLTWIVAIGTIYGLRSLGYEDLAGTLSIVWLGYLVYSWTVPSMLESWYKKRGF